MTKREREARFEAALQAADAAGVAAAEAAVPTPMLVGTPRNMMGSLMGGDDGGFRADRPVYRVNDGVCGFAYVTLDADRGGDSRRFANYVMRNPACSFPFSRGDRWMGTCYRSVRQYRQSLTLKEAYASAFARVLREQLGVRAYCQSRMD